MEERAVDVAIIGAGTAGLNARREAEKAGRSHVLIEGGPYGTTCARVGCMPSKLLIAAADAAHGIEHAKMFGVEVDDGGWRVDGEAVMKRVRDERDRFVGFVVRGIEELDETIPVRGWASFEDPHTLRVDDHTRVRAETIVIATGSSPWIPPQLTDIRDHVLINDDVFEWRDLPKSVAVFGTGVIAIELGQALHRLGVEVDFFNPFVDIAGLQDPEVQQAALNVLGRELRLHVGCEVKSVTESNASFEVMWTDTDGRKHGKTFDKVLAAAGRRPNLSSLSLEHAGIELDDKGRPQGWDPYTAQIGDSHIFMAGDVAGYRPILHEASDEGRIAGSNAARFPDVIRGNRRPPMGIVFTSPNIAFVGARWNDLDDENTAVGEVSFDNQGRSRVMGQNAGLMRLYADEECRFVGAEMIAPGAEHMAHLLAWSIASDASVPELLSRPYYHPVVEEGLRTGVRDLAKKLQLVDRCPPEDMAYGPGS